MKKNIQYLLVFALLISFTACKKDAGPEDNNNDIAIHTDDQSRFAAETDAIANDAGIAIESSAAFSGRFQGVQGIICDATIEFNAATNPMTITITYDGTNCLGTGRTRTGQVILSMAQGTQWKNPGAAITATLNNLKITRTSDNKSITLNGTQVYTNTSGGLLVNLATAAPITHTITSSGLTITFDNGSQRSWQVAKQRVFTYNNGVVITGSGTHSDGTNNHIAEWGTNRFGGAFATSTVEPLVVRQDCNFRLTGGQVKHITPVVTATATFGLNANGSPTSCPANNGNYYYKVTWTGPNGGSFSAILPY